MLSPSNCKFNSGRFVFKSFHTLLHGDAGMNSKWYTLYSLVLYALYAHICICYLIWNWITVYSLDYEIVTYSFYAQFHVLCFWMMTLVWVLVMRSFQSHPAWQYLTKNVCWWHRCQYHSCVRWEPSCSCLTLGQQAVLAWLQSSTNSYCTTRMHRRPWPGQTIDAVGPLCVTLALCT